MKWIRFQDKVPEEYEMILVCEIELYEPEDGPTCYVFRYLNGLLHQTWPARDIDPFNSMHIYYWMPLPPDPEKNIVEQDIKTNRERFGEMGF